MQHDDPRPLHPLQAEFIAAAGAVIVLVSLLSLKWFGVGGPVGRFAPRIATTSSVGGWHALGLLRWLVLLAAVVAPMPLLIRGAQRWLGLPRRIHVVVAALGALTTALLGYRVLIDLPDPRHVVDQKAGAIAGLVGALMIAIGGAESTRAASTTSPPRPTRGEARRARRLAGEIARINA
jgi:hypothetical protein